MSQKYHSSLPFSREAAELKIVVCGGVTGNDETFPGFQQCFQDWGMPHSLVICAKEGGRWGRVPLVHEHSGILFLDSYSLYPRYCIYVCVEIYGNLFMLIEKLLQFF
eukprot:c6002_g1_i1 orf=226-546(+)